MSMTVQTEQKKVPVLRFPGFEGAWSKSILGDLATFSKGKGIPKADIEDDGNFECITYGELYTRYSELIDDVQSRTNLDPNTLVFSDPNDVIIPASGETHLDIATASCVLRGGIALGGDLNIIKSETQGVFLAYYLNSARKKDIASLAQGSSVIHLYSRQLKSLKLFLPSSDEQQKIAAFLTTIDTRIQQLSRKVDLLEQYKKGVMQKIFSQEIRFRDEEGREFLAWEEKRLGDLATFSKGKGISKAEIEESGSLECITYGELYTRYSELIDEVQSRTNLDSETLVLSDPNDVIIPASGETHLDIATASCVLRGGIALGGDLNIIKSKMKGVFLAYYLNNARKKDIARLAQGSSVIHLYPAQLKSLKILIPIPEEQQKIADFLTAIYQKITRTKGQLEQMQVFKKGLLQQLFV